MGTNAAPNITNFLLFCYEYRFLLQIVDKAQELYRKGLLAPLLYMMQLTKRYIDDIGSLYSSLLKRHLYNNHADTDTGLTGIYPSFLNISLSHSDNPSGCVPFLDVCIKPGPGPSGLETVLYDKRELPPLSNMGVKFITFPHISSLLSSPCKYNCLTSQLHRYASRITNYDDFIYRCTSLIVRLVQTNGFNSHRLFNVLRRTLERLRNRLFIARPGSSIYKICKEIQTRYLRAIPDADAALQSRKLLTQKEKRRILLGRR